MRSTMAMTGLVAIAAAQPLGQWKSVAIGGGGYVTGIYVSANGTAYARCDVGGSYRLDGNLTLVGMGQDTAMTWTPLVDSFTAQNQAPYSTESLAIDPNTPGRIYIAVGHYAGYGEPGAILRSDDQGASWSYMTPQSSSLFHCGGNDVDRDGGERLLVHPTNSSIIVFGARDGTGLWSTQDGFASLPTNISLPNATYKADVGIQAISWSSRPDCSLALLAVVPGMGVYASNGTIAALTDTNGWTLLPGSPTDLLQLRHGAEMGTIWAAGYSGVWSAVPVPDASVAGGYSYAWTSYNQTLPKGDYGWAAIAVNQLNSNDIVAAPSNVNDPTYVYRTLDAGKSWHQVNMNRTSTVPWYPSYMQTNRATAALLFIPTSPNAALGGTLCISDWYGIWCTADMAADATGTNATTYWHNDERGHEEVVNFAISGPHVGAELVTGHADVGGFFHDNGLENYPSREMYDQQYIFSIDYTEATVTTADGRVVPAGVVATSGNGFESAPGPTGKLGRRYARKHSSEHKDRYEGSSRSAGTGIGSGYYGYHRTVITTADGGATMNTSTWDDMFPTKFPQRVAMAPQDPLNFVVSGYFHETLKVTFDGGVTWTEVDNSTNGIGSNGGGTWWDPQPLVSDRHTPAGQAATFYYFDNQYHGLLYRSENGGLNWTLVQDNIPSWNEWNFQLATPPGGSSAVGDLWLGLLHGSSTDSGALWRSTNGGDNMTALPGWSSAILVSLGPVPNASALQGHGLQDSKAAVRRCAAKAAAAGLPVPSVLLDTSSAAVDAASGYVGYAMGFYGGDNTTKPYFSVDYGQTWTSLFTPSEALGDAPQQMGTSRQRPGVVFVGTNGRGVFWYDATADIAAALQRC